MQLDLTGSVRTVSQITSEIKLMLENTCRFVAVSGEISNLKTPFSGHHYFTLKDSGAQLRAVMFKGQQRYLAEELRDGQQVICRGRISVYEPRGEYQLIVDSVDQHGLGILQMKFAALKKKLADEGLFDQDRKQPIPSFPTRIVVISSPTGAAIQDFLKICRQRKTVTTIQIFPVPVQGAAAAPAIARAIETVNSRVECDLIVLCRGGGSIEDLWAFNEEIVARAIFHSKIPIISGVGHETDITIADLCADLRAPTPTGAAEIVIPDVSRLKVQLQTAKIRLRRILLQQLSRNEQIISQQWRHLLQYRNRIESLSLRLDPLVERFRQAGLRSISNREELLNRLVTRLQHQAPLNRITYQQQTIAHLKKAIERQISEVLRRNEDRLARAVSLLQGVSPLSTLARGYAIVRRRDEATGELTAVISSSQVDCGDTVNVLLHQGNLTCEVLEKG